MTEPVAVIGAGPAGMSAAIHLVRAGLQPALFERGTVGGLLRNAHRVENYLGFPEGIRGEELVRLFAAQLQAHAVEVRGAEVRAIGIEGDRFAVRTDGDQAFFRTVIVATGTVPKEAGIEAFVPRSRLFYEIKDLPASGAEKTVCIVGGGDAAFDYALNLAESGCSVNVLVRGVRPKGLGLLMRRAYNHPRIRVREETTVAGARSGSGGFALRCGDGGDGSQVHCDFVLVAVGRRPDIGILPGALCESLNVRDNGETQVRGLYLAGDVRRGAFRQTGIAVGDGLAAAMSAEAFLKDRR